MHVGRPEDSTGRLLGGNYLHYHHTVHEGPLEEGGHCI